MSILYTELKADIIGIMEIGSTDADRFNLDENLAIAQVGILNALPYKYITNAIKTVKFDLTNAISLYQWPSDYVKYVEMWVDFANSIDHADDNEGRKVEVYSDEDFYAPTIGKVASKNFPFIDLNVEGGFGLYPVPDATVTNGARLRYVYKLANPTSSQDCLLEYNLKNLMVFKTAELCAMVEEFNMDLAQKMKRLYDEELARFLPKQEKP